jgi:tetratricopeptide (TPR) repeat protein
MNSNLNEAIQPDVPETATESETESETAVDEVLPKTEDSRLIVKMETPPVLIWTRKFELLKIVVINLIIFCVLVSIIFVFYNEWQREPVIIEPFAMPESFVKQGYTGSVLTSRLMDQLSANREASYNRLPDNQKYLFPVEVMNSDVTDSLNIDIPQTGLSLGMIIQYIRRLRGVETRISGDVVGDKDNFELTIRVNGKAKLVKGNLTTMDENLLVLAEYIVENTQPYFLALNYYSKKDYDRSLELIQKTLNNKDKRDDSFAYDLWGNILARKKQYENAIEKYNTAIKINPKNDSPYLGLAYVYYQGYKNYDAAINSYQKVIKRDKTNYAAYNDLALVLSDKGDIKAAIENYQKAITYNPNYANAYYNLGLIFLGKKDHQQAIIQFKKIIDLPYNAGNYFNAYNGLCYSLSQEAKYDEAINNCQLAIKIKPKDDNIYDTLGTVYVAQKDYNNALINYQTAVDFNADNSEAQQHLAEVFAITGKCMEANSHLELALKLDNAIDKTGVQKYCKPEPEKNQ